MKFVKYFEKLTSAGGFIYAEVVDPPEFPDVLMSITRLIAATKGISIHSFKYIILWLCRSITK